MHSFSRSLSLVYPRIIIVSSTRSSLLYQSLSFSEPFPLSRCILCYPTFPRNPDPMTLYRDITSGRLTGLDHNVFHVYSTLALLSKYNSRTRICTTTAIAMYSIYAPKLYSFLCNGILLHHTSRLLVRSDGRKGNVRKSIDVISHGITTSDARRTCPNASGPPHRSPSGVVVQLGCPANAMTVTRSPYL